MVRMSRKRALFFPGFLVLLFFALPAEKYRDSDCLRCHGKPEISQITPQGKTRTLFVDQAKWLRDVHQIKGITCVDCHINSSPFFHFREGDIDVNCARCHPEEEEEYLKNIHLSFRPETITTGKELPLCYHCHTRHAVLRHDDPDSSVHEDRVKETCGECHAEVMISSILRGSTPGKISGHRKGDLGEKFDMNACVSCHYADAAHGNKRVVTDFCSRCHDPASKGSVLMGGTHTDSARWSVLNMAAAGILIVFLIALFLVQGIRSSGRVMLYIKKMFSEIKTGKNENKQEEQPSDTSGQEPS